MLSQVFTLDLLIDDRLPDRTHRLRTQNYIKTLESEVIRLRASEGDLTTENKKLQDQVELLRTSLILANVPLPAGFEGSPQLAQPNPSDINMPATVAFKLDSSNHQRLHVDWPSPPTDRPTPAPAPVSMSIQPPEWTPAPLHEKAMADLNLSGAKPLPRLPNGTYISIDDLIRRRERSEGSLSLFPLQCPLRSTKIVPEP